MGRQIFGVHPVCQETFLPIHKVPLQFRIFKISPRQLPFLVGR